MGAVVKVTGSLTNTTAYLEKLRRRLGISSILSKYGEEGVRLLSEATPVDTGRTAASWRYEIEENQNANSITLSFHNDNVNEYVNIAVILDTGHGTGTGGWVEGRHYIDPAIEPIIQKLTNDVWKEVTKV